MLNNFISQFKKKKYPSGSGSREPSEILTVMKG